MPEPADILLAEVACYDCSWRGPMAQSLRIALIRRSLLAVDPDADVSRDALEQYAACYLCLGISGMDGIELALLDQLSQALAA